MKSYPIFLGFDSSNQIGHVTLFDENLLPPSPDWHLNLGFTRKSITDTNYELVCFGVVTDERFKAYDPT